MIKDLIKDITFDRISISQALTRAKIISYKIRNEDFKEWIISELNGYKPIDLPNYRKIPCDIFAVIHDPFRGKYSVPFDISKIDIPDYSLYKMNVVQSVPTMEEGLINDGDSQYGFEYLPMNIVKLLKSFSSDGEDIIAVKRQIQLSQIRHILSLTKQKLLDTLLELDNTFPNLENDFNNTETNNQMAQTIVNNNIFGNNVNSNLAVGENINQSMTNDNKIERFIKELENLGIDKDDIKEAEAIIKTTEKSNIGKKMMGWIGNLTTKAFEKGIELQLPLVIEKVNEIL